MDNAFSENNESLLKDLLKQKRKDTAFIDGFYAGYCIEAAVYQSVYNGFKTIVDPGRIYRHTDHTSLSRGEALDLYHGSTIVTEPGQIEEAAKIYSSCKP